ncbi:helix-turn-helix domain-containing protein [Aestuariibaculum suncheonense]|uniref:Helix-turn-helix transcriptional regulator n=1 Tax=Aestuariibaculum suncheonense TaxID=1028745 RepID=A0A8J6QAE4_9FLAO|nr:helix-turn-helix transcriptional regulator [Aestuariibaculum suncheonense]MBD0836050.1 helix-turn-helix transcriptional regulator [Aestuariibaculum suncheonense]
MSHTLLIKNMVCARCKMTVLQVLKDLGFKVQSVELGRVVVAERENYDYTNLEIELNELGFELIKETTEAMVEQVKIALIETVEKGDADFILSEVAKKLGKNYSALSKTFSKHEGMTLEKYLINLKIEKVKEYIQLQQLNFSEIAYSLNYKNSSHLAKQFKSVTGMSMTDYKVLQNWERKSIDQIV